MRDTPHSPDEPVLGLIRVQVGVARIETGGAHAEALMLRLHGLREGTDELTAWRVALDPATVPALLDQIDKAARVAFPGVFADTAPTWSAQHHHRPVFRKGSTAATAEPHHRYCAACGDVLPRDLPSDDPCTGSVEQEGDATG